MEIVHLQGHEDVRRASIEMGHAAGMISQAVCSFSQAVQDLVNVVYRMEVLVADLRELTENKKLAKGG